MTLYEFLKKNEDADFDTYDVDYDVIITVSVDLDGESEDNYGRFVRELLKMVEVVDYTCCGDPICDWGGFVERNIETFRRFANKHWYKGNYEDDEEFIAEWLDQFHLLIAGYENEDNYILFSDELLAHCK